MKIDAMFHPSQAALTALITQGGGATVNTSSQWGFHPAASRIAHSATKAAVASFTQNLARDYAPQNIRVNAGWSEEIHTSMLKAGVKRWGRTGADLDKMVAFGRVGKPKEVATFLCGSLVEFTAAQAVA